MNLTRKGLLKLTINLLGFLNNREKYLLSQCLSDPEDLEKLSQNDFNYFCARKTTMTKQKLRQSLETAEYLSVFCDRRNISLTFLGDRNYPELLSHIAIPPFCLYFMGNMDQCWDRAVSVIGTRKPSAFGLSHTEDFTSALAFKSRIIISGLAKGIDSMAHRTALKCSVPTVAVLGGGLCDLYPKSERRTAERILENNGALVSEYAPEIPAYRNHFPARNRIISGLVTDILVMEAPVKSGTMITVNHGLDQGRNIFVCTSEDLEYNAGGMSLVEQGACGVENPDQLIRELTKKKTDNSLYAMHYLQKRWVQPWSVDKVNENTVMYA